MPFLILSPDVAGAYDAFTSTAAAIPAEAATVAYAGEAEDWLLFVPKDNSAVIPLELLLSILS